MLVFPSHHPPSNLGHLTAHSTSEDRQQQQPACLCTVFHPNTPTATYANRERPMEWRRFPHPPWCVRGCATYRPGHRLTGPVAPCEGTRRKPRFMRLYFHCCMCLSKPHLALGSSFSWTRLTDPTPACALKIDWIPVRVKHRACVDECTRPPPCFPGGKQLEKEAPHYNKKFKVEFPGNVH